MEASVSAAESYGRKMPVDSNGLNIMMIDKLLLGRLATSGNSTLELQAYPRRWLDVSIVLSDSQTGEHRPKKLEV